MKWISPTFWSLLIIFSPNLPAVEHRGSSIEQEQNLLPAEEESPWPQKKPPLKLEETELGQALEKADLTAYREAMRDLKDKSFEEASKTLTAIDKNGNNILHRIAEMEKPKDGFLAEAQSLTITLFYLGEREILDELLNTNNKENRSPKKIFEDRKNQIATEYFAEMENLIKLWKKAKGADIHPLMSDSKHIPWNQVEIEDVISALIGNKNHSLNKQQLKILVTQEMIVRNEVLGKTLLVFGAALLSLSLGLTGDSLTALIGASQMIVGGTACYEAFKTHKLLNKHE